MHVHTYICGQSTHLACLTAAWVGISSSIWHRYHVTSGSNQYQGSHMAVTGAGG